MLTAVPANYFSLAFWVAYMHLLLNKPQPRVALISNGQEEGKGNQLTLEAYALLKNHSSLNFVGNIEGRELFADQADVLVCDGLWAILY